MRSRFRIVLKTLKCNHINGDNGMQMLGHLWLHCGQEELNKLLHAPVYAAGPTGSLTWPPSDGHPPLGGYNRNNPNLIKWVPVFGRGSLLSQNTSTVHQIHCKSNYPTNLTND